VLSETAFLATTVQRTERLERIQPVYGGKACITVSGGENN